MECGADSLSVGEFYVVFIDRNDLGTPWLREEGERGGKKLTVELEN